MTSPKLEYRAKIDALIRNTLDEMQCQPILFAGAGFSRRYSQLPDWLGLLGKLANEIGLTEDEFAYLSQKFAQDAISIGSDLTERVFEWAWHQGRSRFAPELFAPGVAKGRFIKELAAEIIDGLTVSPDAPSSDVLAAEIALLRQVKPHAIITTNYDNCLSSIFVDYEEVVGQRIIRSNLNYFGEIFKIHGSTSVPETMVLNGEDYEGYRIKRKYLSAKLLTYLSEHPVFIFGYSVNDPNVVEIIDDVGEVLGNSDQLIPNLFYVNWNPDLDYDSGLPSERVIAGSAGNYRVRSIEADEFGWIFQSLAQERELSSVNTKILRALLARTYTLIRTDIPRKKVEVNYQTLEHAVADQDSLPAVLGISKAENTNMTHPYVLTQVAQKLGFGTWHGANQLLESVRKNSGIDLKKSDNRYHCKVKVGTKSAARKWSEAAVDLLKKVRDQQPYDVQL